jgi:Sperm-tail PG-rich repeat
MKFRSDPAFSFGQRQSVDDKLKKNIPGPGAYTEVLDTFKARGVITWRSRKKGRIEESGLINNLETPGPGTYKVNAGALRTNTGVCISGRKEEKGDFESPGPGHYDAKHQKKYSPAFSFLSKASGAGHPTYLDDPGPSDYNPRDTLVKERQPGIRIANEVSRKMVQNQETLPGPGPGNYNLKEDELFRKIGAKFTTEKRDKPSNSEQTPGPGTYEAKTTSKLGDLFGREPSGKAARGASLKWRTRITRSDTEVPGVGSYNMDSYGKTGKGCQGIIIGKEGSAASKNLTDSGVGPGQYQPKFDAIFRKGGTAIISGKTELDLNEDTPGPGHYSFDLGNKKGRNVVFGGSRTNAGFKTTGWDTPAPGSYEPSVKLVRERHQTAVMGKSTRNEGLNSSMHESPGPGAYKVRNSSLGVKNRGVSFGHALRDERKLASSELGPGHYNLSSTIPNVPKYLLSGKQKISMDSFSAKKN